LWKNIIHDCSQSSVEEKILKLSRTDDVPGSLAPEIWFEFLKTGRIDRLKGICDHNTSDIFGLASILSVIISIAENPVNNKYQLDLQRLALFWRRFLKRSKDDFCNDNLTKTGNELLRLSAQNNYPRAVYVYAYDQMKCGNYIESLKYVNIALKLFDKESVWHEKLLRRKTRLERIINL
ncbi:MAG: ribonuclease H-like domain-containing protein, partial [Treponema sp.]|nr:ribonuclease H-like domain-containing protein [Treponema sp.]